jgi:hypothetical protein
MSFDVFLTAFRNGAAVPADAEAARGVLARYDCRQQPGFNAYGVTFPDGSHVELFATGLDGTGEKPFSGGMFALRGITESVGTLIFEFAAAAGCVAMPADEQGAAVRVCAACGLEHPIGDSAEYLAEAELEQATCVCGKDVFEVVVGVSLYDGSEDVRWLYIGCRCPACGLTGCYGDWKNEFNGFRDLLARV